MTTEKEVDRIVSELFSFYASIENAPLLFGNWKPLNIYDIQYLIYYSAGFKTHDSKVAISKRLEKYLRRKEND